MCWSLLILGVCVCVCRGVSFLLLDGKMVDFGDCSLTVLAYYAPGNGMDDVASLKMDVLL
jgi:hypothetical protein